MAERIQAIVGLDYPAPESLEMVRAAGGISKLTPEQRQGLKLVRVEPGGWCDDLPEESREHLIKKGCIVIVDEPIEGDHNG